MTAAEVRAALVVLGWTERHLARVLGVAEHRSNAWLMGRSAMPAFAAAWLGRMAAAHAAVVAADPPPTI